MSYNIYMFEPCENQMIIFYQKIENSQVVTTLQFGGKCVILHWTLHEREPLCTN